MRLRTRQQYRRMTKGTFRYTGRWILVDIRPTKGSFSKLGITVTKRYGEAHQRNRFKRLVREAFRLSYPEFFHSFDILVRPRTQALQAAMSDIRKELAVFVVQAKEAMKAAEQAGSQH